MTLERKILFEPGYDYREKDKGKPLGKRRGCHGMEIRWLLSGPEGAVQFLIHTHWLPSGQVVGNLSPTAADIGHHWRKPTGNCIDGRENCSYLDGDTCFYDGSGLYAERVFNLLVAEGHEAVWQEMKEYYDSCRIRAAAYEGTLETLVGELHSNLVTIKEKIE